MFKRVQNYGYLSNEASYESFVNILTNQFNLFGTAQTKKKKKTRKQI